MQSLQLENLGYVLQMFVFIGALTVYVYFAFLVCNNYKLHSFGKILPYKWELLVDDYLSF
jgi:hypothetical protein